MKSRHSLSRLGRLASCHHLASAIRGELCCAVFLYGIGDRTEEVLKTIAYGKIVYDAIGRTLPAPPEADPSTWETEVTEIVERFRGVVLRDLASAA